MLLNYYYYALKDKISYTIQAGIIMQLFDFFARVTTFVFKVFCKMNP